MDDVGKPLSLMPLLFLHSIRIRPMMITLN